MFYRVITGKIGVLVRLEITFFLIGKLGGDSCIFLYYKIHVYSEDMEFGSGDLEAERYRLGRSLAISDQRRLFLD